MVLQLYSGTPPFDHLVNKTALLLRPLVCAPEELKFQSFPLFYNPIIATTFSRPEGGQLFNSTV